MSAATSLADLSSRPSRGPSLVTIGVFDGVHLGHQRLLEGLVRRARQSGLRAVVVTFYPHPVLVLQGLHGRYYLTRPREKETLLREQGIDEVHTLAFDDALRRVSAEDFCRQLRQGLGMRELSVGQDFALGHRREGNVRRLRELGRQMDFEVQVNDLVRDGGGKIGSTAIRKALEAGDLPGARRGLGRSHVVAGEVVRGAGRGRQMGFPTANIAVWEQQVIPANGVYASQVWLGETRFRAATNVGRRPHFDGEALTVEPHILDFDRDIYGQWLRVSFEARLRDERKFDSLDALVMQIAADAEASRELSGNLD
ncbi:MAG: bifunctional riboflavin kinase/FAD synthetase [Anaerolineaceae bacterium]|nr:bifunctional riboflavin kinase/FAD synthetase [Anaerolineaceae bacterium]